jgi:hypothetical protein
MAHFSHSLFCSRTVRSVPVVPAKIAVAEEVEIPAQEGAGVREAEEGRAHQQLDLEAHQMLSREVQWIIRIALALPKVT